MLELDSGSMALSQLQSDAYRAVLRAVATTQMDWVSFIVCMLLLAGALTWAHGRQLKSMS